MPSDPNLTLREAMAGLPAEVGLPADADDDARWVKIKIGPIPFAYPNTRGRKKLLAVHDLHHLLAGYATDIAGEAEMAAWELGSGMQDRTGVRYGIRIFGFGLPWYSPRLLRAFVRGRGCRNLLGHRLDDATLCHTVGEMRANLGLDRPQREANEADRRAFRRWAAKAVAIVWGPLVPMAAAAWWWLG